MLRSSLLIAAFMVCTTAPAQSQFKKIKGAIGTAVPQAVSVATTPEGSGVRTADLRFDNRVLEITSARLEQLVTGIEAGQRMAAKFEAPAPFLVSGGKSSPLVDTDSEVNVLREWQSKLEPFTTYFMQY